MGMGDRVVCYTEYEAQVLLGASRNGDSLRGLHLRDAYSLEVLLQGGEP